MMKYIDSPESMYFTLLVNFGKNFFNNYMNLAKL